MEVLHDNKLILYYLILLFLFKIYNEKNKLKEFLFF